MQGVAVANLSLPAARPPGDFRAVYRMRLWGPRWLWRWGRGPMPGTGGELMGVAAFGVLADGKVGHAP